MNTRFIGILSRFAEAGKSTDEKFVKFPHNTVILSGPEPQREILKQKLITLLKNKEPVTILFEGKPDKMGEISRDGNIISYSHLPSDAMKEMIEE